MAGSLRISGIFWKRSVPFLSASIANSRRLTFGIHAVRIQQIDQTRPLINLLDPQHPLRDVLRRAAHPAHRQEDVVVQEIARQHLCDRQHSESATPLAIILPESRAGKWPKTSASVAFPPAASSPSRRYDESGVRSPCPAYDPPRPGPDICRPMWFSTSVYNILGDFYVETVAA